MQQLIRALAALGAALAFACGGQGQSDSDPDGLTQDPSTMDLADPGAKVPVDGPDAKFQFVNLDETEKSQHAVVGIGAGLVPSRSGCVFPPGGSSPGTQCPAVDPVMSSWTDAINGDSLSDFGCGEGPNYQPCIVPDTVRKTRKWRLDGHSCGEDNDGALIRQAALNAIDRWNTELASVGAGWSLQGPFTTGEDFTLFCEDVGNVNSFGHAWPYSTATSQIPTTRSSLFAFSQCSLSGSPQENYESAVWYKSNLSAIALRRTGLIKYIGSHCSYTLEQRDNFILQSAESVWMHEIGHGLGFAHFGLDNGANIMEPTMGCPELVDDWSNAIDSRILNSLKFFNSSDPAPRDLLSTGGECLLPNQDNVTFEF